MIESVTQNIYYYDNNAGSNPASYIYITAYFKKRSIF